MKTIFLFLFKRARVTVLLAVIAGVLSGASHAFLLGLINNSLALGEARFNATLIWGFIGLCFFLPLTRLIASILMANLVQGAIFDLRMHLCRRIVSAPLRHLEGIGIPKLLATLTDDVLVIGSVFTLIPLVCTHATVLLACLMYLGYLNPVSLVLVVFFMAMGVTGFKVLTKRGAKFTKRARENQDKLFSHFRALTEGIKEIKLHRQRRDEFISRILEFTASDYRRNNIIGVSFYTAAGSWGQLMFFVIIGLLLFVMPKFMFVSNQTLTASILVMLYIVSPMDILSSLLPAFGRAKIAMEKIESLGLSLEEKSTEMEAAGQLGPESCWTELSFHGVTHTYYRDNETTRFTLGPVDLKLKPGELVFLVGGNGSGKTTLAKLLTGLYSAESGEVRMNGQTITDATRDAYRQHFSMVFSDFFLFDTLLGLNNGQSSEELDIQAQTYLDKLQLSGTVEIKNGILSSTAVSQGQRKRLALLTSYLEDRPIYVFDEWAADQDPVFKEVFYMHLLPELRAKGKTIIAISHDDRYYYVADRIIKLDYGKVEYDRNIKSFGKEFAWEAFNQLSSAEFRSEEPVLAN
jgi:putative pyoverdin transport system ATP-binding/permease protein